MGVLCSKEKKRREEKRRERERDKRQKRDSFGVVILQRKTCDFLKFFDIFHTLNKRIRGAGSFSFQSSLSLSQNTQQRHHHRASHTKELLENNTNNNKKTSRRPFFTTRLIVLRRLKRTREHKYLLHLFDIIKCLLASNCVARPLPLPKKKKKNLNRCSRAGRSRPREEEEKKKNLL